jgi:flavin-dependent dehydrogenase
LNSSSTRTKILQQREWDFVIIGAGPAGALAAHQLAQYSESVLLLDKTHFPRYKVCGCCINSSAQAALAEAGVLSILSENKAVPLNTLLLSDGAEKATIRVGNRLSISRLSFDQKLIEAACLAGARFCDRLSARVLNFKEGSCTIKLNDGMNETESEVEAKIVLVADGLNGHALDLHAQFAADVDSGAHIGAGIVLAEHDGGERDYARGIIYMACGEGGYVGLVRLEDNRLDIAAAFAPEFVQQTGGPGAAALQLLQANRMPVPEGLTTGHWTGTQRLSRRRPQVGGWRMLVIGDASGYPEPFTGEGIGWALWSGLLSARLAVDGLEHWSDELGARWSALHQQFQRQQKRSGLIGRILRNKLLRHGLVSALARNSFLASNIVQFATRSNLSQLALRSLRS